MQLLCGGGSSGANGLGSERSGAVASEMFELGEVFVVLIFASRGGRSFFD